MTPQIDYHAFWLLIVSLLLALMCAVALVWMVIWHLKASKEWDTQRNELMDRIMAKTLTEYASVKAFQEREEEPESEIIYDKWEDLSLVGTVQSSMPDKNW